MSPGSSSMEGRVALVTGGALGIGAATCRAFAEAGAAVLVTDLDAKREPAEALVASIVGDGGRASFRALDVRSRDDVVAAIDTAEAQWGLVDAVVTSAGVDSHPEHAYSGNMLRELPTYAWDFVLDVNLTGTYRVVVEAAQRLVAAEQRGTVVTLASAAAKKPKGGAYAVSKTGVWMLTRVLADELGPHGIRVNCVGPGYIETPMLAHRAGLVPRDATEAPDPQAWYERRANSVPLRRLGQPEEVASLIRFLSEGASSYVTGSILHPDGGMISNEGGG